MRFFRSICLRSKILSLLIYCVMKLDIGFGKLCGKVCEYLCKLHHECTFKDENIDWISVLIIFERYY